MFFADVITESSGVAIGLAVTVLLAIVGGALWIQAGMSKVDAGLALLSEKVNARIDTLQVEMQTRLTAIEDKAGGRVTRAEMRAWIAELRALNPKLKIPDIPQ